MPKSKLSGDKKYSLPEKKITSEHRTGERREKEDPGFTYITTVGWICRREKCRRQEDKFLVMHKK